MSLDTFTTTEVAEYERRAREAIAAGDMTALRAVAADAGVGPDFLLEQHRRDGAIGPASELGFLISDAIDGRRFVVPWPWPALGGLSRALMPGTVTLLAASPGASKSLMLVEAAAYWHANGHKTALLELEDGRSFHLRRALAQRAGIADLTCDDWCRQNSEQARQALAQHRDWANDFGRCIHALPDDRQPTFEGIADWIDQQATSGARVIAVDPLSIAENRQDQFRHDQAFCARVKRIAERTGASVVLVLHPRKGAQTFAVDDVAGGAAYGRLAQTVLWLESWPEVRSVTVRCRTSGLSVHQEANRVLHIAKARNGRGQGLRLALYFDPDTLRLHERGVVVKRGE